MERYEVDQLRPGYNVLKAEYLYICVLTLPWSVLPDKPLRVVARTLPEAKALKRRKRIFKILVWPYRKNRRNRKNPLTID